MTRQDTTKPDIVGCPAHDRHRHHPIGVSGCRPVSGVATCPGIDRPNGGKVNHAQTKKQAPAESKPSSSIKGSRRQGHGGAVRRESCGFDPGLPIPWTTGAGAVGTSRKRSSSSGGHRRHRRANTPEVSNLTISKLYQVYMYVFGSPYISVPFSLSQALSHQGLICSHLWMNPERITHPSGVPAEVAGKVHLPPPCPSAVSSPGARGLVGSDRPSVHPVGLFLDPGGIPPRASGCTCTYVPWLRAPSKTPYVLDPRLKGV
jgi:hypothetical protein